MAPPYGFGGAEVAFPPEIPMLRIALRVRLCVAVTLSGAKRNRMGLATLRSG